MEVNLSAKHRVLLGKQNVKHLRSQGEIPAIVYGKKIKNIPIQVKHEDLIKVLHTSAGENVIVNLNVFKEDSKEKKQKAKKLNVLMKEIQQDPITRDILHVDFSEVSLTENIIVKVPAKIIGDPIGVTRDGGILDVTLWEFEIECLPMNIPEEIRVNVKDLEIGDTLHIRDIDFPEGIKALDDLDRTVISIAAPKEEVEEEQTEEEIEEPEVIREKEQEEEEKDESPE